MQQHNDKLQEIIVFAGPNGSGKSTITKMASITVASPHVSVTICLSNLSAIIKANIIINMAIANNFSIISSSLA